MSWAESEKLNEWIERAYENGRREEQERIIKLLEKNARPRAASGDDPESFGFREGYRQAIALIKGEQK